MSGMVATDGEWRPHDLVHNTSTPSGSKVSVTVDGVGEVLIYRGDAHIAFRMEFTLIALLGDAHAAGAGQKATEWLLAQRGKLFRKQIGEIETF